VNSILFDVNERVATLTLNRPDTLNALTIEMMDEVGSALKQIATDKNIRALILTGAGRGFCSGQDLRNRLPPDADIVAELMRCYFTTMQAIRNCAVPVITAVNGTAAGGGFSLALLGDIVMAAQSAKFIQIFSRIGLIPDLGSTYLLPRAIGRARALKMMMTNEAITASTAQEWGLISDCVEDEKLMPTARELAQKLAHGPTHTLVETRRMVNESEWNTFEQQFRRELELQSEIRESDDAKEGIAAFIEKRPAQFQGK
jgi:2-(1,2-epoxy-1,2-dihydrophenyl)acetyl-CoA isomerase